MPSSNNNNNSSSTTPSTTSTTPRRNNSNHRSAGTSHLHHHHHHHPIFATTDNTSSNSNSNSSNSSISISSNNKKSSKTTTKTKMRQSCSTEIDTAAPMEYRKYSEYALKVDEQQDDKAIEIKLCSLARPHMRAFHCSWWGFFVAFFIWFAISPLLSEIRDDLQLTHEEIWTSSIAGVAGTIFMRVILGPACDKWGARIPMAIVLCACSIPTACTGFVNSALGLSVLRLFIGCAGGCFVMCQYWTSRMFAKEVAGTANALVGGWGNLGGGVTQLVVGAGLFPLFKIMFDGDASKAWRTVSVIPAILAFVSGIMIYKISDDCPKGQYSQLKKHGCMIERSAVSFFREGICNVNTWILFVQYACCFGTELTMNNAAALYFKDKFDLTTETAAAIASIFGWLNLFARGLGGYTSDKANAYWGMRGRLWLQTILLVGEGALVLFFAQTNSLTSAITVMVFFSLFVQAAEGSTYGIVPYVDPPTTGAIAGIVGAGGNTGAVCFSIGFRQLDYKNAFAIMGFSALGSAFFTLFLLIKGHAGMFCGKDEYDQRASAEALFTPYDNPRGSRQVQTKLNIHHHPIFGGASPIDCNASDSSSDDNSDDGHDCDYLDKDHSTKSTSTTGTSSGRLSPLEEDHHEDTFVPNEFGMISAIIEEGDEEEDEDDTSSNVDEDDADTDANDTNNGNDDIEKK